MAYNNAIPQATDQLSQSQPQILANFAEIQTALGVNHINFNVTGEGKHNYLQFPNVQGSDIATLTGEVAVYSKTGLLGAPALFFRPQSNATVASGGFTEAVASGNGWTRLPSGILLKWGTDTANGGTNGAATAITFPTGATIPVFATASPYNIQLTLLGNSGSHGGGIFLQSIDSVSQFTVFSASTTNKTFWYFAIGS